MPLAKHFKGKGEQVMDSMKKTYGNKKKAESVFYATENKAKAKSAIGPSKKFNFNKLKKNG